MAETTKYMSKIDKTKKAVFGTFLLILLLTVLGEISVFASSTVEVAYCNSIITSDRDLYGEKYAPAQKLNSGEIDLSTGAVNINEIDLSLPGRNGMDLNIYRIYSSQEPTKRLLYTYDSGKFDFYREKAYSYTVMDGSGTQVLISFPLEEEMLDEFYTTAEKLAGTWKEDSWGTVYQQYANMNVETGTVLLQRDKTKVAEDIIEERSAVARGTRKGESQIYIGAGSDEWKIARPFLYNYGNDYDAEREKYYYRFGNEKGEIYNLRLYITSATDSTVPYGEASGQRFYGKDYKLTVTFDAEALNHTIILTDKEGKEYRFEMGDLAVTSPVSVKNSTVTDRFGNKIIYNENEITDSLGRKLKVSENGIEILNGSTYKTLVKYNTSKIYDTDRDPNGLLTIFTKHRLTVSRNVSSLDSTEDVFEETHFITQAKETESDYSTYEHIPVYLLKEVEHPSGLRYTYTYEDTCTEEKQMAVYNRPTAQSYLVPKVTEKSEYTKSDGEYLLKNSRSFKYRATGTGGMSGIAEVVTENLMFDNDVFRTTVYNFDSFDRLMDKSITADDASTKSSESYVYRSPQEYDSLTDIPSGNYVSYRQTPVAVHRVYVNGALIDSTYFQYTGDRKPTLIQKGYQKETYTYDETYGFVIESTQEIEPGKQLKTVATKTEDGKSIAKLEIFEIVDGVETCEKSIDFTYNSDGTVATKRESMGTTSYVYDYSLFDSTVSGGNHSVSVSGYLGNGAESQTTEYDLLGNVKKVTDGNLNSTEYERDLLGRVTKETYADQTVRSIEYDIAGRLVTVTDPNGKKTAYEYDQKGNPVRTYLPDLENQILSVNTYDAIDRKTSTSVYTDASNYSSESYEYNGINRIIKKTDSRNGTPIETTSYTMTESLEKVTIPYTGNCTVTLNGEYSSALVVLTSTVPLSSSADSYLSIELDGEELDRWYVNYGDVEYLALDLSGKTTLRIAQKNSTADVYLTKAEDFGTGAISGTTLVTASFTGDEHFVRPTEVSLLDSTGSAIWTELRDNSTGAVLTRDEYDYDLCGKVLEYRDSKVNLDNIGTYTSRTEYDFQGLPVKEINALGDFKSYVYGNTGNLIAYQDETGALTEYSYDRYGRLIETEAEIIYDQMAIENDLENFETARTEMLYDSNGNLIRKRIKQNMTDAVDDIYKTVGYEYDSMNRLIAVQHDENTHFHDSYQGDMSEAFRSGQQFYTQYAYDSMGNLTKLVSGQTEKLDLTQTIPDGITVIDYEYDRFGNLTKQTDVLGRSETAVYNLIGLPVTTTDRKGVTTSYTYNAYGSPLTVSTGGMSPITYTYNVNNVLLQASQGTDTVTYEYDSLGRLTKETENGIVKTYQTDKVGNITYAEIAGVGTTYTYDALNRLTGASFDGGSASYTYDKAGRLTGETKGGITTSYTYNQIGWLTEKTNTDGTKTDTYALTYYYDGSVRTRTENGVTTTYKYDGLGQLRSENDITYSYDTRGNRTKKDEGDFCISYTYGEDNTIFSEEWSDGTLIYYYHDNNGNILSKQSFDAATDNVLETIWTITYDPLNRMTGFQADGVTAAYTYGIDNMRRSKTVNGVTTNYIWDGANIAAEANADGTVTNRYFRGVGLIASKTGDTVSYYKANEHGDVSAWGDIEYSYDAFGNEKTVTAGSNPFRYCGEYFDQESGFIYLRHRYYDPASGRFTTEDPIRDGLNWYAYCENNPVMFVDPWGLTLTLKGTEEEVQSIWENLTKLSHDKLELLQQEDPDGNPGNEYRVVVLEKKEGNYDVGTNLIRRIISNDHSCIIQITTGISGADPFIIENASDPNVGTGGIIYFNPENVFNSVFTEYTKKNGETGVRNENIPPEIELGHELIHVLRFMGGNFIPYNDETKSGYGTYSYRNKDGLFGTYGGIRQTQWRMEELATTGISYTRPNGTWANAAQWVTTENALRAEHGYGRRVMY